MQLRLTILVSIVVIVVIVVGEGSAVAAPASIGKICGQIRNGPYAAWTIEGVNGPLRLKGRTWTVAVFPGASCGTALRATPALLRQWAKAKPDQRLRPPAGFLGCAKVASKGPANRVESGSGQCYDATGSGFRFLMTGKLTRAQIQGLP